MISDSFGNYGDRVNLPGQRGTDTDGKVLENVDLGGGHDVFMGDLIEVLADDLLEFREEQAQIAKLHDEKERSREEKNVLTELAFMGVVIAGQCQIKLTGDKEANSITETAVLKVREANKIRELYRGIFGIPENRSKLNSGRARN